MYFARIRLNCPSEISVLKLTRLEVERGVGVYYRENRMVTFDVLEELPEIHARKLYS